MAWPHATRYKIGTFNFDIWRGPPPQFYSLMLAAQGRPGVDHLEYRLLGNNAAPLQIELVSFVDTQVNAITFAKNVKEGWSPTAPETVFWEGIDWNAQYNYQYYPADIEVRSINQLARVVEHNLFDYIGGWEVTIGLTLYADQQPPP